MEAALAQLEGPILLWIQEVLRNGFTDPILSFYTKLGNAGMLWIVLCLALLLFRKTHRAGAAGLFALLFSLLLTNVLLKHLVARTRPWLLAEGLLPLVAEGDPNSFPSGHTSASFAAAVALWQTVDRKWAKWAVMAAAVLMGLSRLYVGVHFPSDVIAGVLVGCFCGWAAVKILRTLETKTDLGRRLESHTK